MKFQNLSFARLLAFGSLVVGVLAMAAIALSWSTAAAGIVYLVGAVPLTVGGSVVAVVLTRIRERKAYESGRVFISTQSFSITWLALMWSLLIWGLITGLSGAYWPFGLMVFWSILYAVFSFIADSREPLRI